jgi:predicted anti-sigma-YlaC factor YlaD
MNEHGHCDEMLLHFSDYIDEELGPELCKVLESHLQECKNCTVVFNTMKRTIELYKPLENELSNDVRQRLYKKLDLADFYK